MAIWRAYIDDSGSDGAVLFPDFSKKPVDPMDGSTKLKGMMSPVTSVGLAAFQTNRCVSVVAEWMNFTARIKRDFRLSGDDLPKIHMRYLWGRNSFRDRHKNPYFGMPEEHRNRISADAYNLLIDIARREKGYLRTFYSTKIDGQENSYSFFNSERQMQDRQIIYSRFSKDHIAEKYYNLILQPTMSLISQATIILSDQIGVGGDVAIINYDDSDASKGFDAADLFDVMHDFGFAESLVYGDHGKKVNSCLLQMADLMSFYAYKKILSQHRQEPNWERNNFSRVCYQVNKYFKQDSSPTGSVSPSTQGTAMHYLVARRYLESIDPAWVERHLLTAGELHASLSPERPGVSIVRDSSHAYFMQHRRLP